MAIQRWEPFAHLRRIEEEMDRVWPHTFRSFRILPWYRSGNGNGNGNVPIDAYYTDDALVVRATIPGFKAEDVDLTVTGDRLVLKGEVKGEKETKEERYLIRESRSASFHRSLALPKGLKTEKAEAAYEDGVLTVTIPKTEEVKAETHKIKVKAIESQKS